MVLSATVGTSPTLIYFGQELGEAGAKNAGFGSPSRTSIFDYIGVPAHQRWMNGGKFDGGQSSESETSLRDYYKRLLNFTISNPVLGGNYRELQSWNRQNNSGYPEKVFSFLRWNKTDRLFVINNFSASESFNGELHLPADILNSLGLQDGSFILKDELNNQGSYHLEITEGIGKIRVHIEPLQSVILLMKNPDEKERS